MPWQRWGRIALLALPIVLGAAFLVVLIVRFPAVIGANNTDSDSASVFLIAEALTHAHHGTALIAGYGLYNGFALGVLTSWLPAHRQLWEAAPYLVALGTAAMIAWSVRRVSGRWAAAIAFLLAAAPGPIVLHLLSSAGFHQLTFFATALLGLYLVWLAGRGAGESRGRQAGVALAVSFVAGTSIGSDPLTIVTGFVPFLLASALVVAGTQAPARQRIAVAAGSVALLSVAIAAATTLIAHAVGFQSVPYSAVFAAVANVPRNVGWLVHAFLILMNGDFSGMALRPRGLLAIASAAIALVALGIPYLLARNEARRFARSPAAERALAAGPGAARMALTAFWASAALVTSAAFVFSTQANVGASRYLLPLEYAAAATLPLLATRSRILRLAVAAAAGVLLLTNLHDLASPVGVAPYNPTLAAAEPQIVALAKREHLTYGYAGFYQASALTWMAHEAVQVAPVATCPRPSPTAVLCRFSFMNMASWYRPRRGVRSFLLVNRAYPSTTTDGGPQTAIGLPRRQYTIGSFTLYVYDHDIASELSYQPINP
jgi:hypothetical protein